MRRRGTTLIELVVVLAVMAVLAGVAAFTLGGHTWQAESPFAPLEEARRRAIAERGPVTIEIAQSGARFLVTALPDGGVVADSGVAVDRLSGELRAR